METIEIRNGFKVGFDELIQSVTQLNALELKTFLSRLSQATEQQQHSQQEKILLKQIKEIIPASVVRRFKQLQAKQHNNTITEKEASEILVITDFMEEKSAERINLLAVLAKLQGVSITDLAKQLKIVKTANVNDYNVYEDTYELTDAQEMELNEAIEETYDPTKLTPHSEVVKMMDEWLNV